MEETPERVLVVTPHPDDAEIWCGGTVAKWVKEGAEVHFVLCTDGSKGTDQPELRRSNWPPPGNRSRCRQLGFWEWRT